MSQTKMKRSEVAISLSERIRILRAEVTRRWAVNAKEVKEKRMEPITANKEYLAILECAELAEALERRGMEWRDLLKVIEEIDQRAGRRVVQNSLFQ